MFSLQRLLGRGDRFFELLESSAEEARRAVEALCKLVSAPGNGQSLDQFIEARKEDKRIHQEISRLVCNTFATPFDREDIEGLSSALSRIPKATKKFAERMLLLRPHFPSDLFVRQTELLQHATSTLQEMVRQLRSPRLSDVQEANDRLHRLEGDADKLMLAMFREIYGGQYEALQMIVLRDLFELLEKVIDRCRDAGNVVMQIVLKHS